MAVGNSSSNHSSTSSISSSSSSRSGDYWGYLVKPDKSPSPVFERLLLGIANYIVNIYTLRIFFPPVLSKVCRFVVMWFCAEGRGG